MRLETSTYASPVGPLAITESPAGPLVVEYPGRTSQLHWAIRARGSAPVIEVTDGSCRVTRDWLDAYFNGAPRPFPFPRYLTRWLDLSPVQLLVFRALRRIPFGETRSYDDLARQTKLHPRVVGQLVGSNHLAILIPCHRVVGKRGALVGYGGGIARKRWLLSHEMRHTGIRLR
jgi:methylated-DNA-[protein]-cysteine S-methyltransferase